MRWAVRLRQVMPMNKKHLQQMVMSLSERNVRLRVELLRRKQQEISVETYMMDLPMEDEEQKLTMLKARLAQKLVKELSVSGFIDYQFTTTDFKMINAKASIWVAEFRMDTNWKPILLTVKERLDIPSFQKKPKS